MYRLVVRLIAWMSEPSVRTLSELIPDAEVVRAKSMADVSKLTQDNSAVVVDGAALAEVTNASPLPMLAFVDSALVDVVGLLVSRPWLAHVLSVNALAHPLGGEHLRNVLRTVFRRRTPRLLDWVGRAAVGRRVKLAQAGRRASRLDKLTAYYEEHSVSPRMIQFLRDAAEELLTNAFYDAPVAAGVVKEPISRTRDVALDDEHACDMAYGCTADYAFVRVRDPFGSLARSRLVEVLLRCAQTGQVEVDETMGGAGLGLWRIFSGASVVAVSVVGGRSTEIFVGLWKKTGGARPACFHLFFEENQQAQRRWTINNASMSTEVSLVAK